MEEHERSRMLQCVPSKNWASTDFSTWLDVDDLNPQASVQWYKLSLLSWCQWWGVCQHGSDTVSWPRWPGHLYHNGTFQRHPLLKEWMFTLVLKYSNMSLVTGLCFLCSSCFSSQFHFYNSHVGVLCYFSWFCSDG